MTDYSSLLSQLNENVAFVHTSWDAKEIAIVRNNVQIVYHVKKSLWDLHDYQSTSQRVQIVYHVEQSTRQRPCDRKYTPYFVNPVVSTVNKHFQDLKYVFVLGGKQKMILSSLLYYTNTEVFDLKAELNFSILGEVERIENSCTHCCQQSTSMTTCAMTIAWTYALWWCKFIKREMQRDAFLVKNQPLLLDILESSRPVLYGDLLFRNEVFSVDELGCSYESPKHRIHDICGPHPSIAFRKAWSMIIKTG